MFQNTKEPSSGGELLCLAKVTCGSEVLVHVNSVSIVTAYISCNGKSVCLDTYVKNRNMCMLSGSFHILLVVDLSVVCVCMGCCAGGDFCTAHELINVVTTHLHFAYIFSSNVRVQQK